MVIRKFIFQGRVLLISCNECKNLKILEDGGTDMRPPLGYCILKREVMEIDICDFEPGDKNCPDYVEGEPEWL